MNNDLRSQLEEILSRWHGWCKSFSAVPVQGSDPMFRQANSPKHWQTLDEIADDSINTTQLKAVDFHVSEMQEPHRAAIYVLARNCYTGRSVWMSPRLPQDVAQRAVIVGEARAELTRRLMRAGVM